MLVDADGEQLAGALAERPDLVKVNLAEACSALARPRRTATTRGKLRRRRLVAEGLELCRRLLDAGAAGAVLTLGAAGAAAVVDGAAWHVRRRRSAP